MAQLLLLFIFPIIIVFLLRKQKILRKSMIEPPSPTAIPFIGNFLNQFNGNTTPHEYLWQLSNKYGPLMSMRFGSVPVLIISSERIAKEALKTNDLAFSSRSQFLVLKKLSHIKAVLMNVFLGGTDTVSSIPVWAMTALMKNPMAMEKVQAEIRRLVRTKGTIITEDDIENLPYLKAVIKETLRLHPPTPLLLPRETMEKCIIDSYEIRPKTMVYINAWAIARDAEYWKNPEEFLPERFLDSPVGYKGQDFEFIPFGAGRRGCPGISLGMATVELALANLLYSFDWELPHEMKKEDLDMDIFPGWTMQRKNDLYLQAKNYIHV